MAKYTEKLAALEARIGYEFNDKALLVRALTHPSYGDGQKKIDHYERLEFLGDRVLNLLTACALYRVDDFNEGQMARKLNALVRKETCAKIARDFDIGSALFLSPAEERNGGRNKTSILGDSCEALIAAIYMDSDMDAVRNFYDRFWGESVDGVFQGSMKDPKTSLQEISVNRGYGTPNYTILQRKGPDHNPYFIVEVTVKSGASSQGEGGSKKEAERNAAKGLLTHLVNMNTSS